MDMLLSNFISHKRHFIYHQNYLIINVNLRFLTKIKCRIGLNFNHHILQRHQIMRTAQGSQNRQLDLSRFIVTEKKPKYKNIYLARVLSFYRIFYRGREFHEE